ncbi:HAMP domain-containing sensor histidine kinase [Streptomyces sp. CAU 1734]|uniref:sensor histidine kinase n=1 Tax=Streptomyces sp. CAU 1734 TaxID=3140360 RepID=UPI003261539A
MLSVSALVAACSVAATAWLAVQTTSGAIREEQRQTLDTDAQIYNELREYAATHPRWEGVGKTVRKLSAQYGLRIALTTADRALIADSAAAGTGPAERTALPGNHSAIVDPLRMSSAPLRTGTRSGGRTTETTDEIDPLAVGPFKLTAAEARTVAASAKRSVSCLKEIGIAANVVTAHSGRSLVQFVRPAQEIEGTGRCGLGELARPTKTESRALAALNKLSDACLKRKGRDGARLTLDLSWEQRGTGGGPGAPVPAEKPRRVLLDKAEVLPAPGPPSGDIFPVTPDSGEDRAIADCVAASRGEQLAPHVSPKALLFIGESEKATVPLLDLSPRSTARIAGVAALVLALTVGASLLAATRLVRPLRALTGAAQRMRDGESAEPVPVIADNEVGRLAAAFNDMAAHRDRLEAQRRAMVSDVAHELRTPLSNIRGWLEGAEDGIAEPDEAFISSLLEEAVLLQHIIDDLQDLAEADAGALRLHPEPVRIGELLAQVRAAHLARAEAAFVRLRIGIGIGIGIGAAGAGPDDPELFADPVRLRQAVGNLVANAVRHTPPGGSVTLRARPSGAMLLVEVEDTGEGIAAENLPNVFDRFWRAEKSRSRRTGGSGLGLAIVRKLTEAHGGSVSVSSETGKGSVFTLRLPAGAAAPAGSGGSAAPAAPDRAG